jgi:hypothetical protein
MADEDKDKAEKVAAAKKRVCKAILSTMSLPMLTPMPVRSTQKAESKGQQEGQQ